jgi:hypothetical protein
MQIGSRAETRSGLTSRALRSAWFLFEQEGVLTLDPEQQAGCITRP